tara:strand:- start:135 stop:680 length:546 start_codon:yes stop_codon:yes gene_type:complete
MNIANTLTIMRLMSPFFFIIICLLFEKKGDENFYIFILFVIMSITDYFDGFIARKYNMSSLFGKVFDPISDKILVSSSLLYILSFDSNILYPSMIIIFREFVISGIREFSVIRNDIHVNVTNISKIKTSLQFFSIGAFLLNDILYSIYDIKVYNLALYGIWFAAILTLYTGLQYTHAIIKK